MHCLCYSEFFFSTLYCCSNALFLSFSAFFRFSQGICTCQGAFNINTGRFGTMNSVYRLLFTWLIVFRPSIAIETKKRFAETSENYNNCIFLRSGNFGKLKDSILFSVTFIFSVVVFWSFKFYTFSNFEIKKNVNDSVIGLYFPVFFSHFRSIEKNSQLYCE